MAWLFDPVLVKQCTKCSTFTERLFRDIQGREVLQSTGLTVGQLKFEENPDVP